MTLKCLQCGRRTTSFYTTRRCSCGCTQVPVCGRMVEAATAMHNLGLPIKEAGELIYFVEHGNRSGYQALLYIDFLKVLEERLFFGYGELSLNSEHWALLELNELGLKFTRLCHYYSCDAANESKAIEREIRAKHKALISELTNWVRAVDASHLSAVFFLSGLL